MSEPSGSSAVPPEQECADRTSAPARTPPPAEPARAGGGIANWLHDGPLSRMFKNASLLLSGRGLGAVLGLAYLSLAAQGLGATRFGELILVHAYAVVFSELTSFKSWQAVVRYGADCHSRDNRADFQRLVKFTTLLDVGSALIGTLIAILALPSVGPWLGLSDEILPTAALYCAVILFGFRSTAVGVLRLFDRFDLIAKQVLIIPVVRLSGVLVAFLAGAGLSTYLLVWFLAGAGSGIALVWFGWREFKRQGLAAGMDWHFRDLTSPHAEIWPFVWTANLHSTLNLAGSHFSTLAVGFILGPAGAGLFKVAQEVTSIVAKPTNMLMDTVYPELAKLVASRRTQQIWRLIVRSGAISGLAASAVLLVVFLFGRPLLALLFGADFVGAYGVLMLLLIAAAVSSSTFALDPAMYAIGRPDVALKVRLVTSAIHIVMVVFLLLELGLRGAGVAALLSALATAAAMILYSDRLLKTASHPP